MESRADLDLEELKEQYIREVRKFIDALMSNTSLSELISIRNKVRTMLDEINKKSQINFLPNNQIHSNHSLPPSE